MKGIPLQNFFTGADNDFKAEVMAAEMIEQGVDADRILMLMLGAMKRPFSKDVAMIEEELSDYDHKEYYLVKTPREGIYDMLPEGLFHHPTMHDSGKTEKEIIKNMKLRQEEEQRARKFFLPFETTINYLRMQMSLFENRLDKRSHYEELVNIFAGQWEIFDYLDARQANIFLHLIPIIHDVRDDHRAVETIMEMMLMLPVEIRLERQRPFRPAEPILSKLGQQQLGVDMTTGNEVYDEGVQEIRITVGPMPKEQLSNFIHDGKKSKVFQCLCDYLLPVHIDLVTTFQLDEKDKCTRLGRELEDLNCSLGVDTYL
jgi:type VI secretion system protein ImpH